jgi:transcriptional regulator of acetoin/glycerol metabolism
MNLLLSYNWPGNVRQLEAAIEGMVIRASDGVIRVAQVVQTIPELAGLSASKIKKAVVGTYGMQLIAQERSRFERAIIEANGDRTLAAKKLGLPRTTFFRKAKELGLVRSRQERSLVGLGTELSRRVPINSSNSNKSG